MKKREIPRSRILAALFVALTAVLLGRLFVLQIVNGSEYAQNFLLKVKRELTVKGVRGEYLRPERDASGGEPEDFHHYLRGQSDLRDGAGAAACAERKAVPPDQAD